VIVRIATEGQYELGDAALAELNELDNAVVAACESDNEDQFKSSFAQLLQLVRTQGKAVSEDELVGSDLILPPPDVSMEEARTEFTGEGLIPG
jgi:hypothetical protein